MQRYLLDRLLSLQAAKRPVHPLQFLIVETCDLTNGLELTVVEFVHQVMNLLALLAQANPH